MVIKTKEFVKGLNILSSVKNHKITKGLCLFFTEGSSLYGEVVTLNGRCYKVKLASSLDTDVEFSIIIDKLIPLFSNYNESTFELDVRPNNIIVQTDSHSSISLYGGKGSVDRNSVFSEEGPTSVTRVNHSSFVGYLNDCSAILLESDLSKFVYCKDSIVVYGGNCAKKGKVDLSLEYPIFLDKETISVLSNSTSEDSEVVIAFYKKWYCVSYDSCQIYTIRNYSLEDNYTSDILDLKFENKDLPYFSVNKTILLSICKRYKYYLKAVNDEVLFDIKNNKIIIQKDDKIEVPCIFKGSSSDYTFKKVNIARLCSLLGYFLDDVKIYSDIDPNSIFYLENDIENTICSVIRFEGGL